MNTSPLPMAPLRLPFDATLTMPGSKSHANRAIICACLTNGTTEITNATPCDDVVLLVKNLRKMGFSIEWKDKKTGTLTIKGGIPQAHSSQLTALSLDCGNAGTTLRFLTSLACIVPGKWIITGDDHMKKRPIGDLVQALRALGADIEDTHGCPPIIVNGGTLRGGSVALDASKSSQFFSSLMLISPACKSPIMISLKSTLASPGYVELTENVLKDFAKKPKTYAIEGDWSAAGPFLVLAELTKSKIHFENLDESSKQSDSTLPSVIRRMRGVGSLTIDVRTIPDQLMNLAILAAFRDGETTFTGAANLRLKECDRLAVITKELRKVGVKIEEHEDGVIVTGKTLSTFNLQPSTLDPSDDHRMAMAFAVLGSLRKGIKIKNPGCVSKSYPHFFKDLDKLHKNPRCVAIIGMRGGGKTSLGKKLNTKLKLKRLDSDAEFEKKHGAIRTFVKTKGWKAFRKEEERIIADALRPGNLVILGSGAIESAKTRSLLKTEAHVIWLEATEKLILQRLRDGKRPPLTDLPLEEEVKMILKKRTPLFKELADTTISKTVRLSQHVPFILKSLSAYA